LGCKSAATSNDQVLPGLSHLTARLWCRVLLVGVGSAGISHDFEVAQSAEHSTKTFVAQKESNFSATVAIKIDVMPSV